MDRIKQSPELLKYEALERFLLTGEATSEELFMFNNSPECIEIINTYFDDLIKRIKRIGM